MMLTPLSSASFHGPAPDLRARSVLVAAWAVLEILSIRSLWVEGSGLTIHAMNKSEMLIRRHFRICRRFSRVP